MVDKRYTCSRCRLRTFRSFTWIKKRESQTISPHTYETWSSDFLLIRSFDCRKLVRYAAFLYQGDKHTSSLHRLHDLTTRFSQSSGPQGDIPVRGVDYDEPSARPFYLDDKQCTRAELSQQLLNSIRESKYLNNFIARFLTQAVNKEIWYLYIRDTIHTVENPFKSIMKETNSSFLSSFFVHFKDKDIKYTKKPSILWIFTLHLHFT